MKFLYNYYVHDLKTLMNLQDLIDQLLFEEEGTTLDFKREQYRFRSATDEEKSELLNDILSFANAHRRTDAYILIGVKEIKGGRSQVVGISDDLDDANLQQFINSKTNKPIDFSYKTLQYNEFKLGIIHIPVQRRPFFLTKDVGKLQKNLVYIRRSSSTDIASPDEIISSMGGEDIGSYKEIPSLDVFLVSGQNDEIVEKYINCKLINARLSDEERIPYYGVINLEINTGTNHNYYREWVKYFCTWQRVSQFKIGVKNFSSIVAKDVKVVFEITNEEQTMEAYDISRLPKKPSTYKFDLPFMSSTQKDVAIKDILHGWRITCHLGKIHPKDMAITTHFFYLSVFKSRSIQISTQVFSDDLPEPKGEMLEIKFEVEDRYYLVDEVVNEAKRNLGLPIKLI